MVAHVMGLHLERASPMVGTARVFVSATAGLLLPLTVLLGCGADHDNDGTGSDTSDDSIHVFDLDGESGFEVLGPVEEILGFEDNPIEAVRGLAWTRDGNVLLADADRAVLLISDGGDSLRVLGRPGDGPGEFRQVHTVAPLDDGGALYFDPALNRVTEFSPSFEVSGSWSPPAAADGSWLLQVLGASPAGSLFGAALPRPGMAPEGSVRPSPRRAEDVFWRYAPVLLVSETQVDTVAEVAFIRCVEDPSGPPAERPEGGEASVPARACSPDGDAAAMAVSTHGAAVAPRDWAELVVFGPDLRRRATVRAADPEAEPFSKLVWDHRGRLWFGHWRSPRWWVFDGDGVRRVEFPADFELWDVADQRALGVTHDELGIQRVGVLDLPFD